MNDSERISGILREAMKAVEDAKIDDDDMRQIAFREAIALAAAGQAPSAPSMTAPLSANESAIKHKTGDSIGAIASRLGISADEADRIFHVDVDSLELTAPVAALTSQKRAATQEIAFLVTAGRQAAGIDDLETDAETVRSVCEHYKKLDSPNFSSTIRDLNGVLTVREKGRKKYLKMTQPAWDKASEVAKRVLWIGE